MAPGRFGPHNVDSLAMAGHLDTTDIIAMQMCFKTPLSFYDRSVQMLLSQGASPNLASKGVAAVHLAVGKETEKSIRCLKLLLQHGADPNVRWALCFIVFINPMQCGELKNIVDTM